MIIILILHFLCFNIFFNLFPQSILFNSFITCKTIGSLPQALGLQNHLANKFPPPNYLLFEESSFNHNRLIKIGAGIITIELASSCSIPPALFAFPYEAPATC